ncbi:hypothetical protein AA313_de0205830 [Arthrobotrys entomopaga]|nr:hypothetical protein AA313_de0205830 [Arthrobotrys entomopaga]
MRADAQTASYSKEVVRHVNAYAVRQHDTAVVRYDEGEEYWYFVRKDGGVVTVEQLLAFAVNVYDVCGQNYSGGGEHVLRVEFLGIGGEVVGVMDLDV